MTDTLTEKRLGVKGKEISPLLGQRNFHAKTLHPKTLTDDLMKLGHLEIVLG